MYKSEYILQWIENYIEKNQLSVGDPLPGEFEIAKKANVGRNAVREALNALKAMGIIQSKRKGGITIIRNPVMLEMRHYFSDEYEDDDIYANALQFRAILEWGMSSLIFSRTKPKTISLLRRLLQEMEQNSSCEKNTAQADSEFHRTLTTDCGNHLAELLAHLYEPIFKEHRTREPLSNRDHWVNDHRRILDALEARDETRFLEELKEHTHHYM